jgi:hypothetical protein
MSAGTAGGAWTDLAGSEVRQRLERRGVSPEEAAAVWTAHERGDRRATRAISARLQR